MINVNTETTEAGPALRSGVHPLSLFISVIRENGGKIGDEKKHKATFKRLLRDEEYEDFREAVIDEWVRIKYTTALAAARPLSAEELRAKAAEQKKREQEERASIDKLKVDIVGKALDLVMPNGKPLKRCTGAECLRFGGWFTRIGEAIGPKRFVGQVLSEKDILKLIK
jgi:hypothetical protein